MEYQDVKDWLDKIIILRTTAKCYENFNQSIQAILVSNPEVHIYRGIETIADVMGLALEEKDGDDAVWLSFQYAGVTFFQIGRSDVGDKI